MFTPCLLYTFIMLTGGYSAPVACCFFGAERDVCRCQKPLQAGAKLAASVWSSSWVSCSASVDCV